MVTDTNPIIFSNDERLLQHHATLFAEIVYRHQMLVSVSDGAIDADSWTLTSATANFVTAGIAEGHVIKVDGSGFGVDGLAFAVAADPTIETDVLLRRPNVTGGAVPTTTNKTSLAITAYTFDPQHLNTTRKIKRHWRIDDDDVATWNDSTDLYKKEHLWAMAAYETLASIYEGATKSDSKNDWYAQKAKQFQRQADEESKSLRLLWDEDADGSPESPVGNSIFTIPMLRG